MLSIRPLSSLSVSQSQCYYSTPWFIVVVPRSWASGLARLLCIMPTAVPSLQLLVVGRRGIERILLPRGGRWKYYFL